MTFFSFQRELILRVRSIFWGGLYSDQYDKTHMTFSSLGNGSPDEITYLKRSKSQKIVYQGTLIYFLISFLHLFYGALPLPDKFLSFMMNPAEVLSCFIQLYL